VNDRADVALAGSAAGVHLRADGPETARVRALGPPGWLVGRSVHAAGEVASAHEADYLVFGTVFPTASKGFDVPVAGLDALADVTSRTAVPVLAIGGIDAARASACVAAGAAGVAGISVFFPDGRTPGALGPARAVAALRAAMLE
jgi:thiamine-phosphate diphosphorylase